MRKVWMQFFGYLFASVVISFAFIVLSLTLEPDRYGYETLYYLTMFLPAASLVGIMLLYLMDFGFRLLEGDFFRKICAVFLIILPLFAPFGIAYLQDYSMFHMPSPWWIVPLVTSLMMLVWSLFLALLKSRASHQTEKAKNAG